MKNLFLIFFFLYSSSLFGVDYKYDNANRMIEASYKDGTVVSYTYDQNGNLLSITPNESSSGGDDSSGSDTGGGDTAGTDTNTPETPEPTKNESSGGALGWLTLLFSSCFVALRSRAKLKLKR